MINLDDLPTWLIKLEIEDINFIKKFILYSGSLKDLAKDYDITYPTMRIRLDRLIEKIKSYDNSEIDPYIERIKLLALENKIDLETAKTLISEYKKVNKHGNK